MSDIVLYFGAIAVGGITGILSSLLGIGGGIIFIPALLFGLPSIIPGNNSITFIAVATSLFAGSFSSSSACYNHFRIKNIDKRVALLLASGTIISAIIVPQFVVKLSPDLVKNFIIVILSIVAVKMLFDKEGKTSNYNLPEYLLFIGGLIVGVISSIGGFGGGLFFVPILHYLYGFDIKRAIGTSTLPVAVTMIFSAVSYSSVSPAQIFSFQLGYVHLLLGMILGISSIFGSFFGIKLISKFRNKILKKVFAVLVILMVGKLLF